jgi:hypothetical protein
MMLMPIVGEEAPGFQELPQCGLSNPRLGEDGRTAAAGGPTGCRKTWHRL